MTYIKINKDSLDYHLFSNFHVFTMNNFVRNVMRNGKYKKAVSIVRLGLLLGFKKVHKDIPNFRGVAKTYKRLKRTQLTNSEQSLLKNVITNLEKKQTDSKILKSFFTVYENKAFNAENLSESLLNKNFSNEIFRAKKNYELFESNNFHKLYSQKPKTHFYGMRNLTVFDMVLQVYSMLSGAWYMRKSKVSGRTILIPSPLRPYRRITTVTKMLLKGIRKRRREDRWIKNAMVTAIGEEFRWLLLYNGVQYTSFANMIDNSEVWLAKNESHKELVANLKNIKHLKYF